MTIPIQKIQSWLKTCTPRESALVLLVGWALVYALWSLLLDRPLERKTKEINAKIELLKSQSSMLHEQANSIVRIAEKYSFNQRMQEKKQLTGQEKNLEHRLGGTVASMIISREGLAQLTDQILTVQTGITLVDLKKLDMVPWIPKDAENGTTQSQYATIYKQSFEIKFHGDYFNTMNYLGKLEKLPWRLYWDGLEYIVTQYPNAEVTVKFYILVDQKS